MTHPRRLAVAALGAGLVLATRLPFLATSLDDVDSVNFALAVSDFNPVLHQPHPPGYAVYVVLARLAVAVTGAHPPDVARALGLLSALAQAALPVPLFLLFRRLGAAPPIAAAAVVLTLLDPVVWINGLRPMSDSVGLLFAVGAQAMLLGAASDRGLRRASVLAGLAAGVRVQTVLLTLPAWGRAVARSEKRRRAAAVLALAAGMLAWLVPTIVASGGFIPYWHALSGTASDAAAVEPLVLTWTLNRAARAMRHVLLRPWGTDWLGIVMAVLAAAGAAAAARGAASWRRMALVFGPYLVAHALFQQAHTQRYAMPYVPLLALLATLGMDAVARTAGRIAPTAFLVLSAGAAAAAGAVALPGVVAYGAASSPAFAALQAVRRLAATPDAYVLSGHYMFRRYFAMAPPEVPLVPPRPRREVAGLQDWWLKGGERPVLFLAEPRRTDLESIDPRARIPRGRWAWPAAAARLLSGERPDAVDLVELRPPAWFTGTGWGLSLEMAKVEGVMEAERTAYLKPRGEDALLLFAGEPTDALAADWQGELRLADRVLDRRSCGSPWMAAYAIPASSSGGYVPFLFATSRSGVAAGAPFALRGLAYGGARDPMIVHGAGWHYPETSDDGRPFRWATIAARSLLNVPPEGARLVVEGETPPGLGGGPVPVTLESGGARQSVLAVGRFRLELDLAGGPPREALLRAGRDFVPDAVQRNGDRRRLALRIDYYELITAR